MKASMPISCVRPGFAAYRHSGAEGWPSCSDATSHLAILRTATPMSPANVMSVAVELGYGAVRLRALPAAPGGDFSLLVDDKAVLHETVARKPLCGTPALNIEIVRLAADFKLETFKPFLEETQALGASRGKIGPCPNSSSRSQ